MATDAEEMMDEFELLGEPRMTMAQFWIEEQRYRLEDQDDGEDPMLTKRCGVCGKFCDQPGQVHKHRGRKVYRWTHIDEIGNTKHHDYEAEKQEAK